MSIRAYTYTHSVLHRKDDHRGHIAWRLGSGHSVELFSIAASEHRKGYGRSLLSHMLHSLEYAGIHTVYGFTRERLIHAQLFYKSVGFNLTILPNFYPEGNAVLFSQTYEHLKTMNCTPSYRVYSQNGEDAVLHRLLYDLDRVGSPYSHTFLEVGVSVENNCIECNTGRLADDGWSGKWLDEDPIDHHLARQCYLLPSTINQKFVEHEVPHDLGVLSIDVDGIDYYLWKALSDDYRPAVVIIEYNSQIKGDKPLVVPFATDARWDGTDYFGANALAMIELAHSKGYLLYSDSRHVNLFFFREDLAPSNWVEPDYKSLIGPIVAVHPSDPQHRKYITPKRMV